MNTLTQLELLLTQLYNCSLQIAHLLENDEIEELSDAIRVKDKLLEKIQQVKQTSSDWNISDYDDLVERINFQELANMNVLEGLKKNIHTEFKTQCQTSRLLKTYEPQKEISGNILDMSE